MCCCDHPTINGHLGYKWQPTDKPSIRPVEAPTLHTDETMLYDLPGRCGGLDAHCHHYRIVKWHSSIFFMVKHGAGEERIRLSTTAPLIAMLARIEDNERYWLCHMLYYATADAKRSGKEEETVFWESAAAENRIKTRKQRNSTAIKVWVTPRLTPPISRHPS